MKNHTFYTFDLLEIFQEFFQKIQHKILIKMVKRKNEKYTDSENISFDTHVKFHEQEQIDHSFSMKTTYKYMVIAKGFPS